jgi:hypothetical protein
MPTCSNCQTEVAVGTASCPSCGAAMTGGAPASSGATPQIKFDMTKLSQTDRIVGGATFVLFISLFLTWFSVNIGIGTVGGSGLSVHGYLYIPLLISIVVLAYFVLTATGLWALPASSPVSRDQALLIATAISFVLVLIGFLSKPGGVGSGVGWSYGAFIGLIAAIVALVPLARPALAARRNKA